MNLLFAYVLITGALISGTPRALSDEELVRATHRELAVAAVLPSSPAEQAGLIAGDVILEAHDTHDHVWQATDSTSFSTFVDRSQGAPITLSIRRNGHFETMVAVPTSGLVAEDPDRFVLGVQVAPIGVVPLGVGEALTEGARLTWGVITLSAVGLYQFFASLFTFSADLSQVAGPVGITALIGQASVQGLGDFLSIVAIISVSLALINLVPVPALDGGRLLIVLIESVLHRRVNPRWIGWLNTIALVLLIPLMVIVSIHDIWKLVG
jgi:regulator of sigma E protease